MSSYKTFQAFRAFGHVAAIFKKGTDYEVSMPSKCSDALKSQTEITIGKMTFKTEWVIDRVIEAVPPIPSASQNTANQNLPEVTSKNCFPINLESRSADYAQIKMFAEFEPQQRKLLLHSFNSFWQMDEKSQTLSQSMTSAYVPKLEHSDFTIEMLFERNKNLKHFRCDNYNYNNDILLALRSIIPKLKSLNVSRETKSPFPELFENGIAYQLEEMKLGSILAPEMHLPTLVGTVD